MQKGEGGFVSHAAVAVSCAGTHPLGDPEDGSYAGNIVHSCNEVNLGGAGVGKADLNPS
jgi:hypothetical protein